MRRVNVAQTVWERFDELTDYLVDDLKLSEQTAQKRRQRMIDFLAGFGVEADFALCRFKRWRALGYRCAVFDNNWIFAYETFDDGVIVHDVMHATLIKE